MRAVMIACLLLLCSCGFRTQYGDCIGVADQPKPELIYELSWWNAAVAFVFGETVIVPVYTVAKDIQCPTGRK